MNQKELLKDYEQKCRLLAEFKKHSMDNPIIQRIEVDEILDNFKDNAQSFKDKTDSPIKKWEAQERIEKIDYLRGYFIRILALEDVQAKYIRVLSWYSDVIGANNKLVARNKDLEKELIKYKRIDGN